VGQPRGPCSSFDCQLCALWEGTWKAKIGLMLMRSYLHRFLSSPCPSSQGSSVGKVTTVATAWKTWRLTHWRIDVFILSPILALGLNQPPVPGIPGALSPRVQLLGHKADHSSLSCVLIKSVSSHISTPPFAFVVFCLMKDKNYILESVSFCSFTFWILYFSILLHLYITLHTYFHL
jgi:hypothetical protein